MTFPPPEQNKLLAALPVAERDRLLPLLTPVALERGQSLWRAGDPLVHILFPATLVTALMALGRSGATTALALVGREGAVGAAEALAGERMPHDVVALLPGAAWRLEARQAPLVFTAAATLLPAVLNHGHSLMTQIAQTAFCNLHHTLEQRLCRWLLSIAYRTSEPTLHLTEAQIAEILGVRRESVSQATVRLEEDGLIRHQRGRVDILDRDTLEARACECLPVFPWHPYPTRCPVSKAASEP
ncbi:MAG: Crp/Fnr family transcriptional regulator [Pseudomonadota bacterium]